MASIKTSQGLALLQDTKHSDYVIECAGFCFDVHKTILRAKSNYFKACFDIEAFKEAKEGRLVLEETTPLAVALLLLQIYTDHMSAAQVCVVWPGINEAHGKVDMSPVSVIVFQAKAYLAAYELAQRFLVCDIKADMAKVIISELKAWGLLAEDRLLMLPIFAAAALTDIMNAVLSCTCCDDDDLRPVMVRYIIRLSKPGMTEGDTWKKLFNLVAQHEPVAWKIALMDCSEHGEDVQKLQT